MLCFQKVFKFHVEIWNRAVRLVKRGDDQLTSRLILEQVWLDQWIMWPLSDFCKIHICCCGEIQTPLSLHCIVSFHFMLKANGTDKFNVYCALNNFFSKSIIITHWLTWCGNRLIIVLGDGQPSRYVIVDPDLPPCTNAQKHKCISASFT